MTFCLRALRRINSALASTGIALAGLLLALMLAVILLQVILRYGFSAPLGWSEEVAKTAMLWTVFLVAPAAYRAGDLIAVRFLADALGPRVGRLTGLAVHILTFWVLGVYLGESTAFWMRGLATEAATLAVPLAVFYSIVPPGLLALLMVSAEKILGALSRQADTACDPAEV